MLGYHGQNKFLRTMTPRTLTMVWGGNWIASSPVGRFHRPNFIFETAAAYSAWQTVCVSYTL
jgi:hypothetical protein